MSLNMCQVHELTHLILTAVIGGKFDPPPPHTHPPPTHMYFMNVEYGDREVK